MIDKQTTTTIQPEVLGEFQQVCQIIDQHTARALTKLNEEHLMTCWEIGAFISARVKQGKWGDKVVRELVDYLKQQRPNYRGYGRSNLYNMVRFYETYSSEQFVQSANGQFGELVQSANGQLPDILKLTTFTHHVILLNRCDSHIERMFYMVYSNRQNLNTRELDTCIENNTYANLLAGNKTNLSQALKDIYPQAPVVFKDRLVLDALGLPPVHTEPELHRGILQNMREFILELGKEDFLFVQDECPICVGGETFHLDLLFYHRVLHCYVGIELKSGKFHPKDIGQLEFYLEALDRDKRREGEGPSIGILLCRDANQMVVEYALSRSMSPVMVAQYKQALIPLEVLQKAFDEYLEMNAPKILSME